MAILYKTTYLYPRTAILQHQAIPVPVYPMTNTCRTLFQHATSYLVPGQPNQPTTIKFPKRQFGKFNRAFQGTWFNCFPWLHYDETNDKVFCHTCMRAEFEGKLRTARNKDPAFVIDAWLLLLEKGARKISGTPNISMPSASHRFHCYSTKDLRRYWVIFI